MPATETHLDTPTSECRHGDVEGSRIRRRRWYAHDGLASLVDQGVVSGSRFITTMILARSCGPDALGEYSLGFAFLILFICVQESLVTTPYTVHVQRIMQRENYFAGVVVQFALLALVAAVSLAVLGICVPAASSLRGVALILPLVIPPVLLHELARRACFAELRVTSALLIDVAVATLQLGLLTVLATSGELNAVRALLVLGGSATLPAAIWITRYLRPARTTRQEVVKHARRHLQFGRWILANEVVAYLNWYAAFWMVAALLDPVATGVFAAALTLMNLSNPLILAISNVFSPKASKVFAREGTLALRRLSHRYALLFCVSLGSFSVVIALAGDFLMRFLFSHQEFAGQGHLLFVLALSITARGIGVAPQIGLWTIGRPNINFVISTICLFVSLPVAAGLFSSYGVLGIAYGLLVGSVVGVLMRVLALSRVAVPVPIIGGATS